MEDIIYAKPVSESGFIVTLEDHTDEVLYVMDKLSYVYGYNRDICRIGVIFHDLGKIHTEFQKRITDKEFDYVNNFIFRHEIVSLFFLKYIDKSLWDEVIEMVIGHHRSINENNGILGLIDTEKNLFDRYIKDFDIWSKGVNKFLSRYKILGYEYTINDARECFDYVIEYCEGLGEGISKYRGLLMQSDRIASALGFRVYDTDLNINPDLDNCFKDKNEYYPLSYREVDKNLDHTLIIAPTGAGKTDFLLKRSTGRIFYILPYQASINAMYWRIKVQFNKVDDIRLLHSSSKAILDSEDYKNLSLQKLGGSSIKILTPYQLFNLIFATKGYEMNYLDIKGQDIIIDEIHVYDGNSRCAIERLILLLKDMGCRVHIGTATISDDHKGRLLSILGEDQTQVIEFNSKEFKIYDRHIVHKIGSYEEVSSVIEESIKRGEKIIIVSNTVSGSIDYYNKLNLLYPNVKKILLHSRFKRRDRKEKEEDLINNFNKLEGVPCILISTQVIEVSLDINFDLMVTECAPFPDLIQRFGRINRVRNENTLSKYKDVYVIEPPDSEWKCKPYNLSELIDTYNILEDNKLLEEEYNKEKINKLVNTQNFNTIDDFINYDFIKKEYKIKKLTHAIRNGMEEIINTDSLVAILSSDVELYKNSKFRDQIEIEIPVNYKLGLKYISTRLNGIGNEPIIVPTINYNKDCGLTFNKK